MATKRSKRIDPNAAFAAILGAGEATMPQPLAPTSGEAQTPYPAPAENMESAALPYAAAPAGPPPAPLNVEGVGQPYLGDLAGAAQPVSPVGPAQSHPAMPPPAAEIAAPLPLNGALAKAQYIAPQQNTPQAPAQAPGAFVTAQMPPSPALAPKLVQKGYYITEEQHKRLGIFAVMQGTDRSAIVRAALEEYFAANRELLG